jgi:hypothetical protein
VSEREGHRDFPAEADIDRIRTVGVTGRMNKVSADSFRAVARGVAKAVRRERGVVRLLGGHTIKTGLAPILIRMIDRGRCHVPAESS